MEKTYNRFAFAVFAVGLIAAMVIITVVAFSGPSIASGNTEKYPKHSVQIEKGPALQKGIKGYIRVR